MTTFYLIRHAEKDADDQLLVGRTPGISLSARGRVQAGRLARRLRRERLGAIYSSPVQRARETAEFLAQESGRPVCLSEAIAEIDVGAWTGRLFGELATEARWRRFNLFRSGTQPPGGEAMHDVQARMVGELLRLRSAHPGDRVALVSHGDPIRVAVAYFLGLPADFYSRFEIALASITVLELDDDGARLVRLNETVPDETGA